LIPAELTIRADESQLQQALLNLVLNAIDASPAGGTINLGIHHNQGNVAIDVENSGLPIPESALGRIFEPFFTTKPRGTGLGLAIARNIARAQGGDLVLVSNSAERICFSFALPLSREES
jgi:signal transduction histidine kinase